MQLSKPFLGALISATALALPSPIEEDRMISRKVCTAPNCTAYCEDGFPYDCCVVYIRDPCTGHYLGDTSSEPICYCPDNVTTYFCDAQYFVDPCKKLGV